MDGASNNSFKDLLSKFANGTFIRPADKNAASDKMFQIWKDERLRKSLIDDLNDRQNLLEQLASAVRLECQENVRMIETTRPKFRKAMFDIWTDFVNVQLTQKHPGIEIDTFFPTMNYLLRNNFEIWAEFERNTWWLTLDITTSILTQYSLADVSSDQASEFFPTCISYFEQSVKDDQRKDQTKLAKLLYILVKDIRLLQFLMDFKILINHFKIMFNDVFKWETMNAARTIVLDIVYTLFVELSHTCRSELLKAFMPLFRRLFPFVSVNENSNAHLKQPADESPCFHESLVRFLEVFLACAYPKGNIQILEGEVEELDAMIDSVTKLIKLKVDQQYNKNVPLYRKSPELVIPKHRLRFVVRFIIVQHNLMVKARESSNSPTTQNLKRARYTSCLEAMLEVDNAANLHYLIIYAEIFDKFEHLMSAETINQIIQQVARLDAANVRRSNGDMNTFVRALASLFKSDRTVLPNDELKVLFNKALNWLHIPAVSNSACALLQNLLQWLPDHHNQSQKSSLFDLVLKSICRMSRLSYGATHLLYYIIRTHDFDECFVFRNDFTIDQFETDSWKFRKQIIMFLLKDSEPNVDYSDLLLSLLFVYPNFIQIEQPVLFTEDDIDAVENGLCWITKTDEIKRVQVDKKQTPISTAVISDLIQYLLRAFTEVTESDVIEPQLWRVLSIFAIKAERLNYRNQYFEMTEVRLIQERLVSHVCENISQTVENGAIIFDIGCFWEFVSDDLKNALEVAASNFPNLWKFIVYWKQTEASHQILNETIRRYRLHGSAFIRRIFFKLAAGRNFISKIRLLRTYGKYLNQKEYTSIIEKLRKEFDDEIERAIGDDERINFLKTMFSREVILSANRKAVHFETNLEFLLDNSTPDLLLVYTTMASDSNTELLTWFNREINSLTNYQHQLAFFVQRFFKELPWASYMYSLIEMVDPVREDICFYLPDFYTIQAFLQYLNKFKLGQFQTLGASNWDELLDKHLIFRALFEFRQEVYKVLKCTTVDCCLHLATAIDAIITVLKDLKVQGKVKDTVDLFVLDLVSIVRCFFVKLFSYKPRDNSGLSVLVVDWLCKGVVNAIRIYGPNWIGFMALDVFYDRKEEYPKMWSNILSKHLPFIIKYNLVMIEPSADESLAGFDEARVEFQRGTLHCHVHPVVKTKLFWNWLIFRLKDQNCEKKWIAQLKLLWILCPWLRSKLAQILCLFDEDILRKKNHKVITMFLNTEDNVNIGFMASLLLFDYDEFLSDKVTSSLYCTIQQYHRHVLAPDSYSTAGYNDSDYFVMFMAICFVNNDLCFAELKPFINVVLNNHVFATLAFAIMYQRLEENERDTSAISNALKVLFGFMNSNNPLMDYEILLLSVVAELSTNNVSFLCLDFIRNLVKAGLLDEALFYFKYYVDLHEIPERKIFHIRSNERRSFIRFVKNEEASNVFASICFNLKDDFLVQGLPLSQQYDSLTRAFIAEKRFDFGIAASLYEEIERPFDVSNALYFLGHKHFDLNNKDNYRRVIDLSQWPATESVELSYPKSIENHNSTLYALFQLTCRNDRFDLSPIWKSKFDEIEKHCVVLPDLLDECRDIKLLESLKLMQSSPDDVKLPESFDKGIASTFLLAGWRQPQRDFDKKIFDSLFSRMQKITLERVSELREKKSFQRAQTLVKVLENVARHFEEFRSSTALLELARLHLANNESNAAKFLLQSLAINRGIDDSSTREQVLLRAEGQNRALIMAAEIADSSQKADSNFTQALQIAENIEGINTEYIYESLLKYAKFAFKRYKELDDHTKSPHFILQSEAVKQWNKELEQISNADERNRKKREMNVERDDINRIKEDRRNFLTVSAKNFLRALEHKTEDECIVPSLVSMLIQNVDDSSLMVLFADSLDKLPAHIWLPVQEVLTGYLFEENKPVQTLVKEITIRLLTSYPYHAVYPLYFHSSKANVGDQSVVSKRVAIINGLLRTCVSNEKVKGSGNKAVLNDIFKNTKAAHEMFQEFGNADVDHNPRYFEQINGKNNSYIMASNAFKLQKNFKILQSVPIPTCTQPLNDPNNVSSENMIRFSEIMREVIKANGLSAPKIMEVRGTDGQLCKIIFKSEDLRQDSLVQLLFNLSNIIIRSSDFRSKKLRTLQTYHVVPIDRGLGLIECCKDTESLNDYLIGPQRSGGAHARLRPSEMHIKKAHSLLNSARAKGPQEMLATFMKCCNEISPVFRYFFYENFAQPHSFVKHVQYYTDSLALWSIVCYVVGLGDRHLNNIMINQTTGELVHIDLGMIFEYSKRVLPIPEKVPFRLTRDLVDPILVESVSGRFKQVAMHALEKLQQNSQVIIGISSILLHDPISTFGGSEVKLVGTEKNMLAETAISRLRSKLEGRDLNVIGQTVEQQVMQLINEAKDPKNLSMMFAGWQPII